MWRLVLDPFRALWYNLLALVQQFRLSKWWVRTVALVATLVLTHLAPVALVVCSLVGLGYGHGHPLARTLWDLAMLVVLIYVLEFSLVPLVVVSALVLTDLVVDTAVRARMYAHGEANVT